MVNVTTKEDARGWKDRLAVSSNIKYNFKSGNRSKGKKVILSDSYICQCMQKKMTPKQLKKKEEALKRKEQKLGTHSNNSNKNNNLHLMSNARNKKTNCPSKMNIKVFPDRTYDKACEVQLWWIHNHSVTCFHVTSLAPILPATKDTFHDQKKL